MSELLAVEGLTVVLPAPDEQLITAVDGASFTVASGEVVALVGESGAGKSITAHAIMRILPPRARLSGRISLGGRDLVTLAEREMQRVRGREIGLVFQDPTASLNPVYGVGWQITEAVRLGRGLAGRAARAAAGELGERVGFPADRLDDYPHELSGGMRQRVMLAIALAGEPKLVIADEPTTSLDLLAAAHIRALLADLQRERGIGLLLISHDLGMVGEMADRVVVMYAGQVVEHGPAARVLTEPSHPYTRGLIASIPPIRQERRRRRATSTRLPTIPAAEGWSADACRFQRRCSEALPRCCQEKPALYRAGEGEARCFLVDGDGERGVA